MTFRFRFRRTVLIFGAAVLLGACSAGPRISTTQALAEGADAPYRKVLVIALLSSFDARRLLEDEIVAQLAEHGTEAVPSTSMMNTKTPVTRQTFLAMVDRIDADAVLVSQLASLRSTGTMVDMNPEATHTFRPTYYYNVWSHELDEYVEPQGVTLEHSLVLGTQVYSVSRKDAVWGIESASTVVQKFDRLGDISVIYDEARAIVSHLSRDGLIAR